MTGPQVKYTYTHNENFRLRSQDSSWTKLRIFANIRLCRHAQKNTENTLVWVNKSFLRYFRIYCSFIINTLSNGPYIKSIYGSNHSPLEDCFWKLSPARNRPRSSKTRRCVPTYFQPVVSHNIPLHELKFYRDLCFHSPPYIFFWAKFPSPAWKKYLCSAWNSFPRWRKKKEPPFWIVQTIFRYQLWVFNDQEGKIPKKSRSSITISFSIDLLVSISLLKAWYLTVSIMGTNFAEFAFMHMKKIGVVRPDILYTIQLIYFRPRSVLIRQYFKELFCIIIITWLHKCFSFIGELDFPLLLITHSG